MLYKTADRTKAWKSDRLLYQTASTSFLDLPKTPPKRILELEINQIFMNQFNPKGYVFEEGKLTMSRHLEDLLNLLYYKYNLNENVVGLIRNSNILHFIYVYLDFVIKYHENDENYGAEIMIPCKLIGIFLQNHIFLPIEIASTPLIKTLKNLAKSERDVEQAAGVDALSFMVQPSTPFPEYVKQKFLPLALSFCTSFTNDCSRLGCIYFLHDLFKYINDLPFDVIDQANEQFVDVFNNEKKYAKLFSTCLDCIRMEILYYPQSFPFLLEKELIQKANLFLCSNKHKIIVSANRLFSAIFTTGEYDLSFIINYIKYSSIIDNCGYEVKSSVQESALWLLIDIASRGPPFIQQLLSRDILNFFNDIYQSQVVDIKKLIFKFVTNLLLNSSPDQEVVLLTSAIVETACCEIQIFGESDIYKFLVSLQIGLSKSSSTPKYNDIKERMIQASFIQSLIELEACQSEELIALSKSILMEIQT